MSGLLKKQRAFAGKLALVKTEAGQLGLYRTMQMLEDPLTMVGFEIAGEPDSYHKLRAADAKAAAKARQSTRSTVHAK